MFWYTEHLLISQNLKPQKQGLASLLLFTSHGTKAYIQTFPVVFESSLYNYNLSFPKILKSLNV